MKYFSIDLETTGLDPANDQILEVGMVFDNTEKLLAEAPTFRALVLSDRISGHPFALKRNIKLIEEIECTKEYVDSKNFQYRCACPASKLASFMHAWMINWQSQTLDDRGYTVAGKNFAGFDWPFLRNLPGWNIKISNRVIDPAMFFLRREDMKLPNLEECLKRANLPSTVKHTAVEDALDVCRLFRAGMLNLKG